MDLQNNHENNFNSIDKTLDNKNLMIQQAISNNSLLINRANTFKGNSESAPLPDYNENLKINDINERLSDNRNYYENCKIDKKDEFSNFNEKDKNFQNGIEIRKESNGMYIFFKLIIY